MMKGIVPSGFGGDRAVRGARRDDGHETFARDGWGRRAKPEQPSRRVVVASGQLLINRVRGRGIDACHEYRLFCTPQGDHDLGDLLRGLAEPEHHLRQTLAKRPMRVDAGVASVDEGKLR